MIKCIQTLLFQKLPFQKDWLIILQLIWQYLPQLHWWGIISNNFTNSLSDRLIQFLVYKSRSLTRSTFNCKPQYKRNLRVFDKDTIKKYVHVNWQEVSKVRQNTANVLPKNLLDLIQSLLDKHAAIVKVTRKKKSHSIIIYEQVNMFE